MFYLFFLRVRKVLLACKKGSFSFKSVLSNTVTACYNTVTGGIFM